jgi:hypothetical protein
MPRFKVCMDEDSSHPAETECATPRRAALHYARVRAEEGIIEDSADVRVTSVDDGHWWTFTCDVERTVDVMLTPFASGTAATERPRRRGHE